MGVDQSHLVKETFCDSDDHVLDEGLDGSETGYVLSATVEDGEGDLGALGSLDLGSVGVG